ELSWPQRALGGRRSRTLTVLPQVKGLAALQCGKACRTCVCARGIRVLVGRERTVTLCGECAPRHLRSAAESCEEQHGRDAERATWASVTSGRVAMHPQTPAPILECCPPSRASRQVLGVRRRLEFIR